MPRFNSLGDALQSPRPGGAATVSINGVAVAGLAGAIGSNMGWLNDTTIAGQTAPDPPGTAFTLNKLALPSTFTNIDSSGANLSACGNGVIAAYTSGGGVRFPLSTFGPFPQAGLGDVSPDGYSVLVQNFAAGTGITVLSPTGTAQAPLTVTLPANYLIRARNGVYAYPANTLSQWHIRSLTTGTLQTFAPRTEVIFQTVPVSIGGVLWVAEASNTQLTLRKAASSMGFVLAAAPTFSIDAIEVSAGVARIGWCVNASETAASLRLADVTVGTSDFSLGTTAGGGAPVFTAQPPLTASEFSVGPVEGGGALTVLKGLYPQPLVDPHRIIDRAWYRFLTQLATAQAAGINLSGPGISGTLPPELGGTGATTGLTVINGGNALPNTTQLDIAQAFGPFVLGTGRSQIVAGPITVTGYLQLNGTAIFTVI